MLKSGFLFKHLILFSILIFNKPLVSAQYQKRTDSLSNGSIEISSIEKLFSYGMKEEKLDGEIVVNAISKNWSESLIGRIAGLRVVNLNNGPLSSTKILFREGQSIDGVREALIVLDGVMLASENHYYSNKSYTVDYGNKLSDINPDDIESITVLKNHAAAALYGFRGRNGVVIIKTKFAKNISNGFAVKFNSNTSVETINHWPDFQNQYGQGYNGSTYYSYKDTEDGNGTHLTGYAWGPEFAGQNFYQYDPKTRNTSASRLPWLPYKDNLRDFFKTGTLFTNHLAVETGGQKIKGRFAYTNSTNNWIVQGAGYSRNNIHGSFAADLLRNLSLSTNVNYSANRSEGMVEYNGNQTLMQSLHALTPNMNLNWFKDYWVSGKEGIEQFYPFSISKSSPYFINDETKGTLGRNALIGNVAAQYKVGDNFSLMLRTSLDHSKENRGLNSKQGFYIIETDFSSDAKYSEYTSDFLTTYKNNFRKFIYTVSLGGATLQHRDEFAGTENRGEFSWNKYESSSKYKLKSIYGHAGLGYDRFINLSASYRKDKLRGNSQEQSVSISNNAIGMDILLSEKIKLPFIDQFQISTSYSSSSSPEDFFANMFNYNNFNHYNISEIGTGLRLFERLNLDFSFYKKTEKRTIINVFSHYSTTFWKVKSRGYDINLDMNLTKNKHFNWNMYAVLSYANSKALSFDDKAQIETYVNYSFNYGAIQTVKGKEINGIYGVGFEKTPDGKIVYNELGYPALSGELQYLGRSYAPYQTGFGSTFKIKNIGINLLFEGSFGGSAYSLTHAVLAKEGKLTSTLPGREGGVIGDGMVKSTDGTYSFNTKRVPAHSYYSYYYENTVSNVFSTDYIRLRELRFDYTFSKIKSGRSLIKNIKVGVYGRNLFIFTDWPMYNPEVTALGIKNNVVLGYESNQFPATRTIGLNISLEI